MSSALETRLENALGAIPPSGDETRERARRAALDALGPAPPRRRRAAGKALVAALVATGLVTAGVALAASAGVQIPVVQPEPTTHLPVNSATSPLPPGSAAFVVEINGRVWTARAHGVDVRAGRLSALALSPGALYELQSKGHALRAVAERTGRVAFSHRVQGAVTAAAWSPLPIRIAFVELVDGRFVMHDMWGTGSHDRRSAGLAAPVVPTWRWDSLAVAYVRASGRVAVLTPSTGAIQTLPRSCSIGQALAIAYAPSNNLLAVADNHRLAIVDTTGAHAPRCVGHAPGMPSVAWVGGRRLALGAGDQLKISAISWAGVRTTIHTVSGTITAIAVSPHGHRVVVALNQNVGTSIIPLTAAGVARPPLFTLTHQHGGTTIQWR